MRKIDLHIHTIAAESERQFNFSLTKLTQYVNQRELDCIAITNHNLFDLEQYAQIDNSIDLLVLPGIELDLEGGQLLLISNPERVEDFAECCDQLQDIGPSRSNPLLVSDLRSIFGDLSDYLLIPHYDKKPKLRDEIIELLKPDISAGEVSSVKKFMYCMNDSTRLVPAYFSDSRISDELDPLPTRQTYVSCDNVSFSTVRSCLRDRSKVALSKSDGNALFEVFDNGQTISTGLNVVLGERSSGKSFNLRRIAEAADNVKHIPQFSLVERNDADDEKKFNKALSTGHSLLSQEFLQEFRDVVLDVTEIDLDQDEKSIENYLGSLLKHAKESERHDSFSKAALFSEEKFSLESQKGLRELISSTQNLIENVEFRETIEKYVTIASLKQLIVDLMTQYARRDEIRRKKKWLNEIIRDVQRGLKLKTAATPIADVDLYAIALRRRKIGRFESIAKSLTVEREIMRESVRGFEIVARARPYSGAGELKSESRSKSAFSTAFSTYSEPYDYLQELKNIDGIENADLFRYFVKIEYKILNKDGYEVSGGERSEFNLLQEIQDALTYTMLLIDEPESSFDNPFLKDEVNSMIKSIAEKMPVVIATHNNTVGASIRPDYVLYTEKVTEGDDVSYRVYSGFPTSEKLVTLDGHEIDTYEVMLDCLEAGTEAYEQRREGYEDIGN